MSLHWYVTAGSPENHLDFYCENIDEVLETCGRLFYANPFFEFLLLTVCRSGESDRTVNWDTNRDQLPADTVWIRMFEEAGDFRERYIKTKHELFGMLLADFKRGARQIVIRHFDNSKAA